MVSQVNSNIEAIDSYFTSLTKKEKVFHPAEIDVLPPQDVPIKDDAFQQQLIIKPAIINPAKGYKSSRGAIGDGAYEYPEYDLIKTIAAEDIDAYLFRANRKKLTLCFKEGYDFVGKNPTTVKYLKKRLKQMAHATNITTHQLLHSTVGSLIKVSNCPWVCVRDAEKSGGKVKTINGVKLDPIAGVFIVPPETVRVKTDNNGRIKGFKQVMPDGRYKIFNPRDIIFYAINRKPGFAFGTPLTTAVLDDINTLRRIEANIETLIYKDLFPVYQYKIGTTERPARVGPDGISEVDKIKTEVENMPPEGIFVTTERHEISAIGSEGRALRAEGYIKHFKQRVMSGLNMSGVDLGETEGASKSSSEVVTQGLIDEIKGLQDVFEDLFNNYFIRALLLEGDFKFDPLEEENMVYLKFREIDMATQIAMENHSAQLYSQYCLNHDETRRRMGEEVSDDPWWETSFWEQIKKKELELTHPEPVVAPGGGASDTRGQKSGANRDRPSNQHGEKREPLTRTHQVKVKFKFCDFFRNTFLTEKLSDLFASARRDIAMLPEVNAITLSIILGTYSKRSQDAFKFVLRRAFADGLQSTGSAIDVYDAAQLSTLTNYADSLIERIYKQLNRNIKDNMSITEAVSLFDAVEYRIKYIQETEKTRAFNYGVLVGTKSQSNRYEQVLLESQEGSCQKCSIAARQYGLQDLTLFTIPPHHPNCKCKIVPIIK